MNFKLEFRPLGLTGEPELRWAVLQWAHYGLFGCGEWRRLPYSAATNGESAYAHLLAAMRYSSNGY